MYIYTKYKREPVGAIKERENGMAAIRYDYL